MNSQSEEDNILDLSPATEIPTEVKPDYINYEQNPEKREILEHLRGVLQTHESNMPIISNLSGLAENLIYRIHKTGEMTAVESDSIASALEAYEMQSANEQTERVPGTGEIMLEEEQAQSAARKGNVKASAPASSSAAKESGAQNKSLGLPNRPQLFKIFNSRFFSRLKGTDEYIYIYNDTNTNLRLVVKTGLKDRGTARNSTEFEAFQQIEVFVYDLETNTQIKPLTRTLTWNRPNVNVLKEMNEVICDLLLEVHYRPYCSRHRQSMRLVTPFANPTKQFWGCEECKGERRNFGRENIRGVLTIENHKRKVDEIERRLANATRKNGKPADQPQVLTTPAATGNQAPNNSAVIG
jgi:hypothetical protein